MNKLNPSFVVDLSMTMILDYTKNREEDNNDKQKLFCNCGSQQTYSNKIVRNIVKNHDELTEDSESIKSITCKKCNKIYDNHNKLYLLAVDKDELYNVDFELRNESDSIVLIKKKSYAKYSSSKDTILFKVISDFLTINKKTYKSHIEIFPPFTEDDSYISKYVKSSDRNNTPIKEVIDITNVSFFENFFAYDSSVEYIGLNNAFKLLELIKFRIKDFDKYNINFLNSMFLNSEIEEVKDKSGGVNHYQYVDSGFGDGEKVKKTLIFGDYLCNLLNSYKIFFSINSFEYSSTIMLTKNYDFFKKWIESDYICKPEVYSQEQATNPNKIIETSLRFDKNGNIKADVAGLDVDGNREVLKMSNTIYGAIKSVKDLTTISKSYSKEILNKHEIEELLQKHNNNRVISLLESVLSKTNDLNLNSKHLEHILKCDFDIVQQSSSRSELINVYVDTIRVINLLDLKDKLIFKCKTYDELKEMHDDLTSRFNAMKDLKKAELFMSATKDFSEELNCRIGDVEFEVVSTSEKLNLEGLQMQHCIYTYLNRICEQRYIAINVTHLITKERATAGFTRNGNKLSFEQLKGYYNSRATEEMILCVTEFCNVNSIRISSHYDLSVDKHKQRPMPKQMSEEDLFKLREECGEDTEKMKKLINKNSKFLSINKIKKYFS